MRSLYYLSVWIHVLAALFWLGGMWFLALVGAPVLRRIESAELRRDIFRMLGEHFRRLGWVAIGVLVATGVLNLSMRGLLDVEILASGAFWRSRLGQALGWKLAGVAAMIVAGVVHDFYIGPAASRLEPGSPAQVRARRRAAWLARANAVLGIGVVYAAVILTRG